MRKFSLSALGSMCVFAFSTMPAYAISFGPDFVADYIATDLGSVVGLSAAYGGMAFKFGDPNTLLIGGSANTAAGRYYEVPVIRDVADHIVGFGAVFSALGDIGEYNDGGIAYGPDDVLFTAQWNANNLGQTKPGSTDEDKIIDLTAFGITTDSSISGLNFVPAGFNGAGSFKIVSWQGGSWFDIALLSDGSGTFDIISATLVTILGGGPEGFVFIEAGNPGFVLDSLLIAEFSAGAISVYDLDANGDPLVASRRDFITGLTGAEGLVIDPMTGDILFSTFGGGDRIVAVQGLSPPSMPDSDGDSVNDNDDWCPDTASGDPVDPSGCSDAQVDGDGDGVCDPGALSAGPSICTGEDVFPDDPFESSDNDGDGIGDNADTDDDNDGQTDFDEITCGSDPFDAGSTSPDLDGDSIPDCVDLDNDNDSVDDANDLCLGTVIPEAVPTSSRGLGRNRWALTDNDFEFDAVIKGKGPNRSYSTADTAGCSCAQIIGALGLGEGHSKFGCSIGAMDNWVELVTP